MTILTFFDPSFWFYFILFWVSIFLAFFIPGDLILRKLKLSFFQRIVLGTIVGMVLWGWQGFIFGYIGARWLSYFYLLVLFIVWLKISSKNFRFKLNIDPILTTIVTVGIFIQLSTVWFTGILYTDGLYFCCGNIFDSILHIALTSQIVKQFPPYEPGMFGVFVQNYHYWANLVVGELARIFRLPVIHAQYQYMTLFTSLFLGLSSIVLSQIIGLSKNFARWITFFLYFGGDSIFVLLLLLGRGFNTSMSSLEDGVKFLVNPPRALSIIVLFAGISLFLLWLKRKDLYSGVLMAVVLGSLIGLKVYTGIFVLSGLGVLGAYFLLRKKIRMLLPILASFILSVIIYLPVNAGAGGLYYTGLWRFENFIVQPALGLERLELARVVFYEHSNWLRVIEYELIFIALYVMSIFGSKLIGLLQTRRSLSLLPRELNIFLITGILVSAMGGFFFQQNVGSGANSFNFLVSVFIIGSIYAALACYYWLQKVNNKIAFLLVLAIVTLTLPRVVYEGFMNVNILLKREGILIGNNELQALQYLKESAEEKALVLVDHRKFGFDLESPYISFLADRPMFLSGINDELIAHGIDFSDRELILNTVLKDANVREVGRTLFKSKIDYIYMSPLNDLRATESAYFTQTVFKNPKVKILKVSREAILKYIRDNYNLQLQ